MKIVQRKTADLIPYANNSRTHSEEQVQQIAASIREFGFTNPLLIDEHNGIIAGHGRLAAARLVGMEKLPCIVLSGLSDMQKRALIIADNKLAINAGWDRELLAIEIEKLREDDYNIDLLGFADDEIDELLGSLTEEEAGMCDEDEVPEEWEEPVTEEGDIWVLGNHVVICGDSTDVAVIDRVAKPETVDCLITDPPYNVAYEGKTKDKLKIQNDAMSNGEFRQFLVDAFVAASTALKKGAAFYIWHADSEGYNFRGACYDAALEVRQCLIWVKNTMVLGRQDYQWKHEPCLYGWKDGASHKWYGDRKQTTVIEYDKPARNAEHPTMKPVGLMEYLLSNSTRKGDIVLDTFGGSGSTLIACAKTGRKCRMIELDPIYVDVIVRRWEAFTGLEAVHENGRSFQDIEKERLTKKAS